MTFTITNSQTKTAKIVLSLFAINLTWVLLLGYLTLSQTATINSQIGALALSVIIPLYLNIKFSDVSGKQMVLKFGTGIALYGMLAIIMIGFVLSVKTALLPSILLALAMLFYGKRTNG